MDLLRYTHYGLLEHDSAVRDIQAMRTLVTQIMQRTLLLGAMLLSTALTVYGQDPKLIEKLQEQVRSAPTVTFCELHDNTDRYKNSIVRVRAIYMTDFEESAISSPECDLRFLRIWIEFDPEFEKLTERKWRNKVRNMKWRQGLDVVFVGKFESGFFGHLDRYIARLTVLSVENVQPLGKFEHLPEGAGRTANSSPTIPRQVAFCQLLASLGSDDIVRVAARLTVLKDEYSLYEESCKSRETVFAEFAPNWKATTDPSVAKTVENLRDKSSAAWLKSNKSSVTLSLRTADVVLEGFIIPNQSPARNEELTLPRGERESRAAYSLLFVVQRVILIKEQKSSTR